MKSRQHNSSKNKNSRYCFIGICCVPDTLFNALKELPHLILITTPLKY